MKAKTRSIQKVIPYAVLLVIFLLIPAFNSSAYMMSTMINAISKMRDKGITILVVEHNMQILDILDSVTVISFGQKIYEGTPQGMR
ncbi:MAG: hypothetical protein LUE21_04385 [Oscillospiraceae bacterium]|nr:hypothetical protein [Oscillospiraceae bacterium]